MKEGTGNLEISVTKSSALYILSEEDIPHMLLTTLMFPQIPDGFDGELLLSIQDTINEKNVRKISPELRKCIFPDEPSDSAYRRYSYSTCVTECLKKAQIKTCNCTHYNMIVDENDRSPICDYNGLSCLDKRDLMFPQTTIMQPWQVDGLGCTCLPSCNEPQINVVGRSSKIRDNTDLRTVSIRLQQLPSQRYFRQAVREELDIVGEI
jgi:amiloride-sensitive sodium channel